MNLEMEEMTQYERKRSARAMEYFAGMVDNIDQNIGKIVEYLKKIREFEGKQQSLLSFNTTYFASHAKFL